MAQTAMVPDSPLPLLTAIADRQRCPIDARNAAVVVAHPDDETIGCGALLARLDAVTLVLVTDGAPTNLADAHMHGFSDAASYREARRAELEAALGVAGVTSQRLVRLEIPDQQAGFRLEELTRRLMDLLRRERIATVLTHAFEGGHPDHDAAAFAVHSASWLLAAEGWHLMIIEMPFYRLGSYGMAAQSFAAPDGQEVTLRLTPAERARKLRMMAAHRTQQAVLATFHAEFEQFRAAPRYDFTLPPNEGALFYDLQDWGITGEQWRHCARAALVELRVTP